MFPQMLVAVRCERKANLEMLTRGCANERFVRRMKSVVKPCHRSPEKGGCD